MTRRTQGFPTITARSEPAPESRGKLSLSVILSEAKNPPFFFKNQFLRCAQDDSGA
jgi:hypothetical protein